MNNKILKSEIKMLNVTLKKTIDNKHKSVYAVRLLSIYDGNNIYNNRLNIMYAYMRA